MDECCELDDWLCCAVDSAPVECWFLPWWVSPADITYRFAGTSLVLVDLYDFRQSHAPVQPNAPPMVSPWH